jgi:hypothetical protein
MRYEMEGMAQIRRLVTGCRFGLSHEDFDAFKRVLSCLEARGFELKGPPIDNNMN